MFAKLGQIRPGHLSRYFCTALRNGNNRYDVVVVGGGMVGFGLAALAASSNILQGKRILLLENMPKKSYQMRDTFEARVVALSCSSQLMLQKLNAWEFVQSKRAQPVKAMKVWEDKSDAFLVFERDPLAYIVENDLVIESLRLVADKAPNPVTVEYNALVDEIELPSSDQPDQLARVHIRSLQSDRPRVVETNLVVGADGVKSKVREIADLQTIGWDHGQAAVVATLCKSEASFEAEILCANVLPFNIKKRRSEPFTAWQRFVGNGPIALLPLSADCSSLTWSTTNEEADRLLSMSETDFVQSLNYALTKPNAPTPPEAQVLGRLGQLLAGLADQFCGHTVTPSLGPTNPPTAPQICHLQSGSKRMKFPLGFLHANNYHASRAVLVGDAAHRILPLAGQGVNLGFGDVTSLVQCLEEAVSQGADLGSATFLQEYTFDRQRAVLPIAATMELLNLLYSTDAFALKLSEILQLGQSSTSRTPASYAHQLYARVLTTIRSAGLNTVQYSALVKDFLMNAAITGQIGVSPSEL
ncbi:Coenzyme Q6 monooxygenase [Fasciola hepatica]|uniref:Coenzyme Q6 monooxygenase n=1 Tax=Fasciola hepatica TaxID=6192 RepID=A0A4E0R3S9_FASHE|nr:Coenzyme Q6 monooxygenase [Fasciola hepatica]